MRLPELAKRHPQKVVRSACRPSLFEREEQDEADGGDGPRQQENLQLVHECPQAYLATTFKEV